MIPVRSFLAILLLGCVIPLAVAHIDGGVYGTPKTYCEMFTNDWNVHDYGPDASTSAGYFVFGFHDGNLEDCNRDQIFGDYDGHSEWATGGAWLLASDAGSYSNPFSGAITCFGEGAHHPQFPNVWVFDHLWPSNTLFVVGVDTTNFPVTYPNTGFTIDCGDGIDDVDSGYCVDHCAIGFPPGTDGSYHVYVVTEFMSEGQGDLGVHFRSAGHVYT